MNKLKAFTIIELLVVVAIIGILSAMGINYYQGYTESSAQKAAENSLRGAAVAQQDYNSSYGKFYGTSGTSGGCSPTIATTNSLIENIFGGTDNLTEQKYFFCSTGNTTSFTLTAKHKTKNCKITLNEKNIFSRTNCS